MKHLIGFEEQFNSMVNSYESNNLHSSIIISGPKGIGKRNFIDNFINKVLQINFVNNNLNHHENLFKNNTHPNIKIVERIFDQKTKKLKNFINIEQIRNLKKFLNESSAIKNLSNFIIIDSADDLNINSANSLLKNLEEPKNKTFIFLVSHHLSALLPTIRSRCLKIKLSKHNFNDFKKILSENVDNIEDEDITLLYDLTYGSPGTAISLYKDDIIEVLEMTLNCLLSNKINQEKIILSDLIAKLENDRFKSYLSLLKSILIILNKLKIDDGNSEYPMSKKLKLLNNISNSFSKKNIIDRFEFLTNNEIDLFTYNLDKKIFMMKFLTN